MDTEKTKGFASKADIYEVLAWVLLFGLLSNGTKIVSGVLGPIDMQDVSMSFALGEFTRALALSLPTFLLAWAVYDLANVFDRCSEGKIFTDKNVRAFKLAAIGLFWATLVSALIAPSLISWLDGEPRGFLWETDNLSLGVGAISVALFGFADILAKAVEMKTENDEIV